MRRSMLFLPGNTPNILINGDVLGADAVIFDLEDAVALTEKDAARILVRNAIAFMEFDRCDVIVRINSLDTEEWKKDLQAIVPHRPNLIMPPKISSAQDVQMLDEYLSKLEREQAFPSGTVRLIPLIETALGVEQAFQIATASARVAGLLLGGEDLATDLRCKRTKGGEEIRYARSRVVCAARAAGIEAYDTPFIDVDDDEGAYEDAQYAKGLGFAGKAAISPRHVRAINEVFSPTRAELDYAYEVVAVIEEAKRLGRGAISLHGKMVDAPIVSRAQQVIEMAEEIGKRGGRLG